MHFLAEGSFSPGLGNACIQTAVFHSGVWPTALWMLRFPYLPCEHQGNSRGCACCCLCMPLPVHAAFLLQALQPGWQQLQVLALSATSSGAGSCSISVQIPETAAVLKQEEDLKDFQKGKAEGCDQ